jgi:hypothetical protein
MNNKSVTVHNTRSKIPPSTSTHFATRVRWLRVVRLSWYARLSMRAAESKLRASNFSVQNLFIYQTRRPSPPKNLTADSSGESIGSQQFYRGNHTNLDTSSYELTMTDTITYNLTDLPPCSTLYVYIYVVCLKSAVNGKRKQTKQKVQTN